MCNSLVGFEIYYTKKNMFELIALCVCFNK